VRDRRLTPANARVAASRLRGQVAAEEFTDGTPATIAQPVVDLCATPAGARDRQMLFGAGVTVFERRDGWAFVQANRDGYVGYVPEAALGAPTDPTHRVTSPATHIYADDSFKSPDLMQLPFGAQVTVVEEHMRFFETRQGFIPKPHLRPVGEVFEDPAAVAEMFIGVPYLWGGNSSRGIDCSGLIQTAYHACGFDCGGDSDMQRDGLGVPLAADADLMRGDLVFWAGHVAMMVDSETMIHANAHHMAVVYEGLAQATDRIKTQGDGDILARRRVL